MIIAERRTVILAALLIGGCSTPDPLERQRTVFSNPYAMPVIDRTGIGPQCDRALGEDATCLGIPLTRRGRGSTIGEPVVNGFNRNQRRILRERAELLRQVSQQAQTLPTPPPPLPSPILPTADTVSAGETEKP